MKIKNLFITLGLALAAVGVAAGVGSVNSNMKEAKADSKTTFYLDCTGFAEWDNAEWVCLHAYKSVGDVNNWIKAEKAGDNYWSVSFDVTDYTGVEWYRCKGEGDASYSENHFNKQSWLALPSSNFYYEVGGWNDPGDNKQWSAPVSWSLTGDSSASLSSHKFDADGYQYYATSVELEENDVIEFTNGTLTTGYSDLRDVGNGQTAKEKGLVEDNGADKVKVVRSGSYDIYVNCITGKVWMQQDSASEADHWAEEFIASDCATLSTGTKAKWGDFNTSYNSLTEGAKEILSTEDHVEHDVVVSGNVKLAVQRYDYVLQRYGINAANDDENGYADFMGRAGKLPSGEIRTISGETTTTNNTTLIIVLASVITLAAVGGYFLLRKRED